jgi:hypothetical protein
VLPEEPEKSKRDRKGQAEGQGLDQHVGGLLPPLRRCVKSRPAAGRHPS